MRSESPESASGLRSGYTTGACATATSLAAARLLLLGSVDREVTITLPKGQQVAFSIYGTQLVDGVAQASTNKDAGDDPDVTHGARVFACLSLMDEPGVRFSAAKGVGTVTRSGLSIPPGEPAINPVPRQMMEQHLNQLAKDNAYQGGFHVAIGIEGGEALALKTMNGRLGIVGGLSILGTTGIVRPFSCSAYIASIHQGIDVARHNAQTHLLACTGSVSETTAQRLYALPDMCLIEMGDFVGAVLKYVKRNPVKKLSLVGGFGKFSKFAQGAMDLHSRKSTVDMAWLAERAGEPRLAASTTSLELLSHAPYIGDVICACALEIAQQRLPESVSVEVIAVDRKGRVVGRAES